METSDRVPMERWKRLSQGLGWGGTEVVFGCVLIDLKVIKTQQLKFDAV